MLSPLLGSLSFFIFKEGLEFHVFCIVLLNQFKVSSMSVCDHVLSKTLFHLLTKKWCFSLSEIVLLNAAFHTDSVNQLLISWNMHGLPAGTQQGALGFQGMLLDTRRHPNYALLQIGSLCLQCSRKNLGYGFTAQKFQAIKLWNQELHIKCSSKVPFTSSNHFLVW